MAPTWAAVIGVLAMISAASTVATGVGVWVGVGVWAAVAVAGVVAVGCGADQQVLEDTKRLEDFRVWDWKIVGASVEKVATSRNSPLGREGTILVGRGVWNLPSGTDQVEVVRELERQGLGLTFVSCGRDLGFGAN